MRKDSYVNISYQDQLLKPSALSMIINLFTGENMIKLTGLNIKSRIIPM